MHNEHLPIFFQLKDPKVIQKYFALYNSAKTFNIKQVNRGDELVIIFRDNMVEILNGNQSHFLYHNELKYQWPESSDNLEVIDADFSTLTNEITNKLNEIASKNNGKPS